MLRRAGLLLGFLLVFPVASVQATELHHAAASGDLEKVRAALKAGVDVNAKNQHGATALHLAAHQRQVDVVKALLAAGADPNARNRSGRTPLHSAASAVVGHLATRHSAVANALLEAKADPNARTKAGKTPLQVAVELTGGEPVHFIGVLLEGRADPNAKTNYKDGSTLLHLAASQGKADVAKALLQGGANVNAKNRNGATALHRAAHDGNNFVIKALLQGGADVNAKDRKGNTPLHLAAANGVHADIQNLLLEAGADPNAKNNAGDRPCDYEKGPDCGDVQAAKVDPRKAAERLADELYNAIGNQDLAGVQAALKAGADPNYTYEDVMPALFLALRNTAIVKALLAAGANPNIRFKAWNNTTVLHRAVGGYNDAATALVEAGADINAKDNMGHRICDDIAKRRVDVCK